MAAPDRDAKTKTDSEASTEEEVELEPFESVDRYQLIRIHSVGGLGKVWLAADAELDREVALKELLEQQAADPKARARFLREARITGQLEHPNIVPIYEMGERGEDRRPYYTMRFVRGPTLGDAIAKDFERRRAGRRSPRRRRRLLRALGDVCNAIAHAHSRGIVHRDLKPENIILGRHGELILLDWGLAKPIAQVAMGRSHAEDEDDDPLRTRAGSVMGTLAYMAPEQAAGHAADERTDVYGLGAILFEILTGRPPHRGENAAEVLRDIIEGGSPRPRAIHPTVPPALDAICNKAMAKDPADRYESATEVAEDLERWLADEPVSAYSDPITSRVARLLRRHQSWVYASGVALLLIVLVVGSTAVSLGQAAQRERQLREQSIQSSAKLAARSVAIEIELRWRILEQAAADDELNRSLAALAAADRPLAHRARHDLQGWLEAEYTAQSHAAKAVSWFVADAGGAHLARAPFDDTALGRNFAFRDYFHGLGKDLPEAATDDVEPIRRPHRSIVFRSQITNNLMVAFSVPIWSDNPAVTGSDVLGVLGMTVELGRFGVLQLGLGNAQIAALIDTREDWRGRRGLILHHAELARLRLAQRRNRSELPTFYAPPELVSGLEALRANSLERQRRYRRLSWEEQLLAADESTSSSFSSAYEDPVSGGYSGTWSAAFEPVTIAGRPERQSDTGWVVIVQERNATR